MYSITSPVRVVRSALLGLVVSIARGLTTVFSRLGARSERRRYRRSRRPHAVFDARGGPGRRRPEEDRSLAVTLGENLPPVP